MNSYKDNKTSLDHIDSFTSSDWHIYFKDLAYEAALEAQSLQTSVAKLIINREKNRYMDVLPYDHTRVKLNLNPHDGGLDSDYINANYVRVLNPLVDSHCPSYLRQYILTQEPLPNTVSQFWLMVWQQKSKAIIMLNQTIEKGVQKCFPYFPGGYKAGDVEEHEYEDIWLLVRYLSEENHGYYIKRTFHIEDTKSGISRTLFHFHYLTWPDFGVPRSPGSFLNFVWAVRASGALNHEAYGPVVIHCSAGIGRSGTFVVIDSILAIVELSDSMELVSVRELLLLIRQQRMGLIQSPEQLSFSYAAIKFGCRILLETNKNQRKFLEFPMSENENSSFSAPDNLAKFLNSLDSDSVSQSNSTSATIFQKECSISQRAVNENNIHSDISNKSSNSFYSTPEERQRIRASRQAKNQTKIEEMRKRINEEKLYRWRHSLSFKLSVGTFVAGGVAIAFYLFWPSSQQS